MKYQMPEPRDMDNTRWGYDSEDVQAAFDAGRAAGLEQAANLCLAMRTVSGIEDVERGFNASLRRATDAIRNLAKETP